MIKSLKNTPLPIIIECFNQSFANYFVKMPTDIDFWAKRFKAARLNQELSFGYFDKGELVGFILNGVDYIGNDYVAYNTGTGVLPEYRGNKIVDKLFEYAIPKLKKSGINKCLLEVIEGNDRAVKVYQRIGFSVKRKLLCFKGELNPSPTSKDLKLVKNPQTPPNHKPLDYAWDSTTESVISAGEMYNTYQVFDKNKTLMGYFVIDEKNGNLAQIEKLSGDYGTLLNAIQLINPIISIKNIDEKYQELICSLKEKGLKNHINQFEMEMGI